jgi:hypothetical protein
METVPFTMLPPPPRRLEMFVPLVSSPTEEWKRLGCLADSYVYSQRNACPKVKSALSV